MPEDFFADGFGEQQGVAFSKQEDEFLQKKIVFLDPMKTYQISIGKVLALLKYTNLDNETIKKILNNSCKSGIGQKIVTYEEMKKIFRGVALKQNKIEPSKINIEANIKTKMPVFYDDDDDDDEEEQSRPPQHPPQPPQRNQPQQPQRPSNTQPPHTVPINQPPQPPKVQQPPASSQTQMNPLKAYDEYWKSLKTKNNLIDGTEVKKMFSNNSASKNNLSKAWKLCNISEKGVLTKGEFFIFMNLIHNPNIPEALTKEMKDLVHQIEEACGYKKSQPQPTSQQRASSSSGPAQRPSTSKPNDAFDKFGDQSLFAKNSSKVDESVATKPASMKNTSNVFSGPASNLASSMIITPSTAIVTGQNASLSNSANIAGKSVLQLLEKVENIGKQEKVQQKQVTALSVNNEQLIAGLGSIEQYLAMVEKNMQATTGQIQVLKQTQHTLNERLNNVCLKFKTIITKQSECIAFLMDSVKVESESNHARLQVLETYTQQMVEMVEGNFEMAKNGVNSIQKQSMGQFEQVKQQNQQLRQRLGGSVEQSSSGAYSSPFQGKAQNNHSPQTTVLNPPSNTNPPINKSPASLQNSPQPLSYSRSDPFEDNQPQQHTEYHNQNVYQEQRGNSTKSIDRNMNEQQRQQQRQRQEEPTNHFSVDGNINPSQQQQQAGHIYLQNLSPQQRQKTKQMLLIQILNSVSSMNQQEYAQVVSKVVAMTEEQMNQSYTKLYALYMQNLAKTGNAPKYPVPSPEEFTAAS